MRQTHMSVLVLLAVLLAIVLAACRPPVTPASPTATVAPAFSAMPPAATAAAIAPGGVDIAMNLVTIPNQPNVAIVDGEAVSTADYREELNRALYMVTSQYQVDWSDPQNLAPLPELQEQVLDQVIERVVMRHFASQEGVKIDPPDVEAEITALQGRIQSTGQFADWAAFLKEYGFTEATIRSLMADSLITRALTKLHGGPSSVLQVHASHILVETKEIGQEVLDKLAKGEAFAALAAQYSTDTGSKDQGGDLGWFPSGAMVSEFDQAAFSLEPGKVSSLVQTQYGYHIILVHEKALRELEPEAYAQMQEQQAQVWIDAQRAKMKIERLAEFASK